MLDPATANGKASFNGSKAPQSWQPVQLPEVSPRLMPALNAFFKRRAPIRARLGGRAVEITSSWQRDLPAIAESWTLAIRLDQDQAELVLPEALVQFVLRQLDAPISFDTLTPEICGLLIEHALTEPLNALEAALGASVTILSAQKDPHSSGGAGTLVTLPMRIELEGAAQSWCLLRVGPAFAPRLAEQFDKLAGPLPGIADVPVPTRIRWAVVDLTLEEIKSLMPGDIVLVDHHCSEHETAVAVVGDRYVAPVKAVPDGYQILRAAKPIKGSEAEWCSPALAAQDGPLGAGSVGEIPVRVFFEFATIELQAGKLRDLKPGMVIGSGEPFHTYVNLMVDDSCVGRGEPTTIGSALGVRIIRK